MKDKCRHKCVTIEILLIILEEYQTEILTETLMPVVDDVGSRTKFFQSLLNAARKDAMSADRSVGRSVGYEKSNLFDI